MATVRRVSLVFAAALSVLALVATGSYAASVDLNLTPLFGSGASPWSWCPGSSCVRTTYVAVHNFGGSNSYSHLFAATFDGSECPMSIEHMYAVNCSTAAVTSELSVANDDGVNDWTGNPTVLARRAALRPISVGATICYRVDFGFSGDHEDYEGCQYEIFVKPKSTDTDSDHGEYGTPLVNHGETATWEMD